jgi:hypothetical protein
MKKFWHYVLEGFLIVFSVLFALYIENYVENLKTKERKQLALERIRLEIARNSKVLAEWMPKHDATYQLLYRSSLTNNDSLKKVLLMYNYFNINVLTKQESVFNTILTATAWETAQSTQIASEFDFELMESLTQVYALQSLIMDRTLQEIIGVYLDRNSHDLDNVDDTLKQFEIRYQDLTGQEKVLASAYNDVLTKLY